MIEMNPYYFHSSSVGPVYDVAQWSRRSALGGAVMFLVAGAAIAVGVCFAWEPRWFFEEAPAWLDELPAEILKGHDEHPWLMRGGIALFGLFAAFLFVGAIDFLRQFVANDFYLRAGPGGLSLRVSGRLAWSKCCLATHTWELDLPWEQIEGWKIVQVKRLGSLSQNAGNLSASMTIRTTAGKQYDFSLIGFREPSHVIYNRIQEATELVPAQVGEEAEDGPATSVDDKCRVIPEALLRLLQRRKGAVVFSDAQTGKFVQFEAQEGTLVVDLPVKGLDAGERARATQCFGQLDVFAEPAALEESGGVAVAAEAPFRCALGDNVRFAAELALVIFVDVFGLAEEFPLLVEEL